MRFWYFWFQMFLMLLGRISICLGLSDCMVLGLCDMRMMVFLQCVSVLRIFLCDVGLRLFVGLLRSSRFVEEIMSVVSESCVFFLLDRIFVGFSILLFVNRNDLSILCVLVLVMCGVVEIMFFSIEWFMLRFLCFWVQQLILRLCFGLSCLVLGWLMLVSMCSSVVLFVLLRLSMIILEL